MISLDTEVKYVKGVGEKKAGFLAKLGIFSLRDLLRHFPREYEDRRTVKRLIDILPGESACVEGTVISAPQLSRVRRGLDIVRCRISDGSAKCDVSFFNQSWQRSRLVPGEEYIFYGKFGGDLLRRELTNPVFEPADRADSPGLPDDGGAPPLRRHKAHRDGALRRRGTVPRTAPGVRPRALRACGRRKRLPLDTLPRE